MMARNFLFADEAGDFNFSRGENISRYFIVCTVTMECCDVAHDLLELRRELIWKKQPVGEFFHATRDKQAVRDAVFEVIRGHKFVVQATIMEKAKAQPQVRISNHRFYQYGWHYHFRHAILPDIEDHHQYLITAASIGTKKGQAVFTSAINDVVQQHLKRENWRTAFWPCSMDPCLQVADYCTWAIQRKWERGDTKSFGLIQDRIGYEYDLWVRGTRLYY